jgi:hypothetical protein
MNPSRKMTHEKPANPAKAGLATEFPACASSATDANPWVMRTIRKHNNENTWRHHRQRPSQQGPNPRQHWGGGRKKTNRERLVF